MGAQRDPHPAPRGGLMATAYAGQPMGPSLARAIRPLPTRAERERNALQPSLLPSPRATRADATATAPMLQIPARSDLRLRPILTERLMLAPLDGADAQDLWRAVDASRMHLAPWLSWVPFVTDAEASFRFADGSGIDWDQGRACRFTVRDRQHHGLLGVVSFEDLQHLHRSGSLGYWLRHDVVRRGFMTEAARAGVRWAFGTLGAHRVSVAAATQNAASLAVIHRLGFHFEGIARQAEFCAGRWLDHARFSLLTSDVRDL